MLKTNSSSKLKKTFFTQCFFLSSRPKAITHYFKRSAWDQLLKPNDRVPDSVWSGEPKFH
jgi:hypothetical protein